MDVPPPLRGPPLRHPPAAVGAAARGPAAGPGALSGGPLCLKRDWIIQGGLDGDKRVRLPPRRYRSARTFPIGESSTSIVTPQFGQRRYLKTAIRSSATKATRRTRRSRSKSCQITSSTIAQSGRKIESNWVLAPVRMTPVATYPSLPCRHYRRARNFALTRRQADTRLGSPPPTGSGRHEILRIVGGIRRSKRLFFRMRQVQVMAQFMCKIRAPLPRGLC